MIPLDAIRHGMSSVYAPKSPTFIYTYFGQALGVEIFGELSSWEIAYLDYLFSSEYPYAQMNRSSSARYNCHSYAWFDQSTSNHYWLNSLASNGSMHLQCYWTHDYYYSTTEESAEKVFYSNVDHSAIALSTAQYTSKWGTGPLMTHSPTYCPYISSNRQYYRHRTHLPYDITSSIVGDLYIFPNTVHNYSLPRNYSDLSISWSTEPLPGIQGTSQVTANSDGSCSFSATAPGAYYLYLKGYRNGQQVIAAYLIIIVYGV